ncbi:hypothetical protein [Actinomadura hibisca]|uniref:hypothetical protein n=1 Tax=Actinomadura hibisca TaxID=68565 RepID=UPI000830FAB1|nr:hypothetical protein [Actinomadura hibisca]
MRPDGDPDDYGLPHVDVVVPDDARELARDVLAYQRERRQLRRRARLRRLLRPVTRFGVVVPLIAGALLVALVSGALMTTFGPRPMPRPSAALLNPHPSASPGRVGGWLPEGRVELDGARPEPVDVRAALRPGVIGIAAPGCGCARAVDELAGKAREFELNFWLVGDPRGSTPERVRKEMRSLRSASHRGAPQIVLDAKGLLAAAYAPQGRAAGLTAVLVEDEGVVTAVVPGAQPGPLLTDKIKALS